MEDDPHRGLAAERTTLAWRRSGVSLLWGAAPFTGRHLQTLYGRLGDELRICLLVNAYALRTSGAMPGAADWVGRATAAIVACPLNECPDPRYVHVLEAAIAAGAPLRRFDDDSFPSVAGQCDLVESIAADLLRMVLRTPTADHVRETLEDWIRHGQPELPDPPPERRQFLRLFYEWSDSANYPLVREPPLEARNTRKAIVVTSVDWSDLECDDDDDEPIGNDDEPRAARSQWKPPPFEHLV